MTLPYGGSTKEGLVVEPFGGIFSPDAFRSVPYELANSGNETTNVGPYEPQTIKDLGATAARPNIDRTDGSLDHTM